MRRKLRTKSLKGAASANCNMANKLQAVHHSSTDSSFTTTTTMNAIFNDCCRKKSGQATSDSCTIVETRVVTDWTNREIASAFNAHLVFRSL